MPTANERLRAVVTADSTRFKREMGEVRRESRETGQKSRESLMGTKTALLGIATAAATAGAGIAFVTAKLASAAGQAIETRNRYQETFKQFTQSTNDWIEEQKEAIGYNTAQWKDWLATVQDTLVPMGMAREQASKMSQKLVKLAVDLGSFKDVNPKKVMEDMQSGLVGQHRALRKYGVVIQKSTIEQEAMRKGLADTYNELTELQKLRIRYNQIIQSTTDAQGDAKRTAQSYANLVRRLKGSWTGWTQAMGAGIAQNKEFKGVLEGINQGLKEHSKRLKQAQQQRARALSTSKLKKYAQGTSKAAEHAEKLVKLREQENQAYKNMSTAVSTLYQKAVRFYETLFDVVNVWYQLGADWSEAKASLKDILDYTTDIVGWNTDWLSQQQEMENRADKIRDQATAEEMLVKIKADRARVERKAEQFRKMARKAQKRGAEEVAKKARKQAKELEDAANVASKQAVQQIQAYKEQGDAMSHAGARAEMLKNVHGELGTALEGIKDKTSSVSAGVKEANKEYEEQAEKLEMATEEAEGYREELLKQVESETKTGLERQMEAVDERVDEIKDAYETVTDHVKDELDERKDAQEEYAEDIADLEQKIQERKMEWEGIKTGQREKQIEAWEEKRIEQLEQVAQRGQRRGGRRGQRMEAQAEKRIQAVRMRAEKKRQGLQAETSQRLMDRAKELREAGEMQRARGMAGRAMDVQRDIGDMKRMAEINKFIVETLKQQKKKAQENKKEEQRRIKRMESVLSKYRRAAEMSGLDVISREGDERVKRAMKMLREAKHLQGMNVDVPGIQQPQGKSGSGEGSGEGSGGLNININADKPVSRTLIREEIVPEMLRTLKRRGVVIKASDLGG